MLKKLIPVLLLTYSFSLQMAAAEMPERIESSKKALTDNQYYLYAQEIAEELINFIEEDRGENYAPLPEAICTLLKNASGRSSPTEPVINTLLTEYKNFLDEIEPSRDNDSKKRECLWYKAALKTKFYIFRAHASNRGNEPTDTDTKTPRMSLLEKLIELCEQDSKRQKRILEKKTISCPICYEEIVQGYFFSCTHYHCQKCYGRLEGIGTIKRCGLCRTVIENPTLIITQKEIEKKRFEIAKNRAAQQQRAPSPLTPAFIPVPRVPTNSPSTGQLTTRRLNTRPNLPTRRGRAAVTPATGRPHRNFEGAEDLMYDIEGNPLV